MQIMGLFLMQLPCYGVSNLSLKLRHQWSVKKIIMSSLDITQLYSQHILET
jgi:hypothetical protein